MEIDYHHELLEQLEWHWKNQLRPRLDGLTDAEYFWEPAVNCWSIRRREDGSFCCDCAPAEPSPPPVTILACRLAPISLLVLGLRVATHVDGISAEEYANRLQA